MRRDLLNGKFQELLENEVKILETCQNTHIVQLYDIKKTPNNIYMIFEYCNEGDMSEYVKKKGHLSEEEAVKYFLEIIDGFKILVKHNVIHRDFKLANILKHQGSIKISDFGFSKLLDSMDMTQTIVGSPLNMAPEIIMGKTYNNKVDIWSLGIVFYEMLFGVPPFVATSMFELLQEIKTCELKFPRDINNISAETEDILKRMLVVDPEKRIEWRDIFKHKIILQPQQRLNQTMQKTMNWYSIHRSFHMNTLYFLMCESLNMNVNLPSFRQFEMNDTLLSFSTLSRNNSELGNSTSTEGTDKTGINILSPKGPLRDKRSFSAHVNLAN